MHLHLSDLSPKESYKLLSGLIIPRPIAWVSTISVEGGTNLAPFSFFNIMGVNPPIVAFAPGDKAPSVPKDTAQNIASGSEFVVNLVDESLMSQMVVSAQPHASAVSEIELTGLTVVPSVSVSPPRVAEAPVSMECKEVQTLLIGGNRLIIGEVLELHVKDEFLESDSTCIAPHYAPVGRLASPDVYCRTTDQFRCSA